MGFGFGFGFGYAECMKDELSIELHVRIICSKIEAPQTFRYSLVSL